MSARNVFLLLLLFLCLIGAGLGWMFWIQNSSHQVVVSMEFWGGRRVGHTWKAPELIAISAGVGFMLGFIPPAFMWMRRASDARKLRNQLPSDANGSSWR